MNDPVAGAEQPQPEGAARNATADPEPTEPAEEAAGAVPAGSSDLPDESASDGAAGASDFGSPGQPLMRHSPFYVGFFGGAGALVAFWLGQQILSISSILILIVVAMFVAVGLNPLVELCTRRGLKRAWALVVVFAAVVVAVGLFVLAIVPVISDQVATIADRAPDWFNQLRTNNQIQQLDEKYDLMDRSEQAISDGGWTPKIFGGVLGFGLALVSAVANAFIVIVLTMYFLASLPAMKHSVYQLAPASRRARVGSLGDQILDNVGGYVSGAFVVALCAGISSLIFLFSVGLGEYAVALAFVVAVLDVIPMIGATLGAIIVIAIGFATDPKIGLFCLIFYVLYQQFENYVIYPRVMSRSVDISGSLIVISALVGAALLGVVGALLAIPTAAALRLLLREVFLRRQDAR